MQFASVFAAVDRLWSFTIQDEVNKLISCQIAQAHESSLVTSNIDPVPQKKKRGHALSFCFYTFLHLLGRLFYWVKLVIVLPIYDNRKRLLSLINRSCGTSISVLA